MPRRAAHAWHSAGTEPAKPSRSANRIVARVTRPRRRVAAGRGRQVLSYAGYLQGLDLEQLESQVLGASVLAAVQAAGQQHAVDAEEFRDGLARSLAEGSFRFVIVLDSAPGELVQVAGYLQSVTGKIDIDPGHGSAPATSPDHRSWYPSGSTRAADAASCPTPRRPHGKPAPCTRGSAEFRSDIASRPPAQQDPLVRLADRADALEKAGLVKLATVRGKNGRITLLPRLPARDVAIRSDVQLASGDPAVRQLIVTVAVHTIRHQVPVGWSSQPSAAR
jgi:hypothetical protein